MRSEVLSREDWTPISVLMFFCGIVMIGSLPPSCEVGSFESLQGLVGSPIYFYTYVLLSGIVGLTLGAISVTNAEMGRRSIKLLWQRVAIAQGLTIPFLVFQYAAWPGKIDAFVVVVLHTTIVSGACAMGSRIIEEPLREVDRGRAHSASFIIKYVLLVVYYVVPLIYFPVTSPLGFSYELLTETGPSVSAVFISFSLPIMASILFAYRIVRSLERGQA